MKSKQSFWDRIWRDKHDRLALAAWPNPPLVVWIVLSIVAKFTHGKLQADFSAVGSAFLFVWAYKEITEGESYVRRFLGAAVLVLLIHSLIS